jgi:predicted MFS family arabinose efflux permease
LLLMAAASGLGIANLYLPQPLLGLLTVDFDVSDGAAGLVVTFTQLGYAAGILLITPLADVLDGRALTTGLWAGSVLSLIAAAIAPSLFWLILAVAATGLLTVTPQIMIVIVAHLGTASGRARGLAVLAGGAMVGNSLAYLFSGTLGDLAGWRAVYGAAAGLSLALLFALRAYLPRLPPPAALPYRRVMASLPGLLREQPALRQAMLFQMCAFGSYTAFWATLPFHLREQHGWGAAAVGLLGVLVVGPALALPYVGRVIDRRGALFVTRLSLL